MKFEKTSAMILDLIDYVIASEAEDFEENPSEDHIYYTAITLAVGEEEAKKELKEALNEIEETEE